MHSRHFDSHDFQLSQTLNLGLSANTLDSQLVNQHFYSNLAKNEELRANFENIEGDSGRNQSLGESKQFNALKDFSGIMGNYSN